MGDIVNDDNDDIVILDEIKPINQSKNWKWRAPNPKLKLGDAEHILQKVRSKLKMESPVTESNTEVTSGSSNVDTINTKRRKRKIVQSCTQSTALEMERTPEKSLQTDIPTSLTPEEIQELTENCLDSDNEPELTPMKQCPQNLQSQGPKRALNFSVKASSSIRNRPSRFFGAGTSHDDVEQILSQGNGLRSSSKSPSPKKKRLSKNSPIRMLPSHRKLSPMKGFQSPNKTSPGRNGASTSSIQQVNTVEKILEGPYYYEAFSFIIKKVCDNPAYKHLFLKLELMTLREIHNWKEKMQLYIRLMNRKDKWNRCSDISYSDISSDLSPLFDFLESRRLVTFDMVDEKLDVLLHLLKMEELKKVCSSFKIKKSGNKPDLVAALLHMVNTQTTLNGHNPLRQSVTNVLGRCVRLTMEWRLIFRRCILLFSMFHSSEDLDQLSSDQALMLLQVKLERMVFPLQDTIMNQCSQIFFNRDQLIRFEEAKELSQEINIAMQAKNHQVSEELATKCMKQFIVLLDLADETNHVLHLPPFLQKFCAGSTYAFALTKSVEALKQGQKYNLALSILECLLNQKIYCPHYRGRWALAQSSLLHINLKNIVKACQVLCAVLENKCSLSPVDQMHLQQRAEKVYKLKKNGLSKEYKDKLKMVMDPPCKAPEAVEISARAFQGSKPGLKKIYVRDTDEGKAYMSVEETVIAHYRSLGLKNGFHDEGSTIFSLCLLSLWNHIYDASIPSVFQTPYQRSPLDWGSKFFYETRKDAIESHFQSLLSQDVKSVAEELLKLFDEFGHTTCVVNWDRIKGLDVYGFLDCVTIPVFVAVSRRLIQDWKSHRSGFPDLVVWSPPQKMCLFIEVKSPNDTLSLVQYLWLDFLSNCNAKAIVAHVRECGSKSVMRAKSK